MTVQKLKRLVLGAVMVGTVAALQAHVTVLKTFPADGASLTRTPERVHVWFNQAPSARLSRLDLRGPSGDVPLGKVEVDAGERSVSAAIPEPLPPGGYEVTWRTAGDDGHVMRGTFKFSIPSAE